MESYRDFVIAQSERNPSLKNLCKFLTDTATQPRLHCDITSLDFFDDGPRIRSICTPDRLSISLRDTWVRKGGARGRMLIIQDLTIEVVEILGSALDIDPLFFAAHLHSPWPDISTQTPETAMLPSRIMSNPYINMHYHRTIKFDDIEIPKRKLFRNSNVHRKVMVLPKTKGVRLGLAQHCCSVFKSSNFGEQWTCKTFFS